MNIFFTKEVLEGFAAFRHWLAKQGEPNELTASVERQFMLDFLSVFTENEAEAVSLYTQCKVTQHKFAVLLSKLGSGSFGESELILMLKVSISFCLEARVRGLYERHFFARPKWLDIKRSAEYLEIFESMPFLVAENVTEGVLNSSLLKTFAEQAPKLAEHIDSVKGLEAQVTKAEKTLTNQKNAFTFVGLEQGFATLSTKKENLAKEQGKLSYTLMSFILALPFLLGLVYYFKDLDWLQHLYLGLPALSLELLLLYFYRVNLQHLRSTEAQIVQLELRQALCQVIQNYTDYSSEIKAKDPSALERFEALIFSGLTMDEKNVPTSFDGLEPLANLIKSFKK